MQTPQDRTIQVGKFKARYWAEGSSGTPVVLIHGLGGYLENWFPTINTLAQGHRVFAADLPGFGRTDKLADTPYGAKLFVQFIFDFLDVMGLERASLVGHSMGGGIALSFTIAHPQRVDRLVLVGSGGLGRQVSPMLRLASLPGLGERFTRPSLKASTEAARGMVYDPALVTDESMQLDYEIAAQPGTNQAFLKTLRSFVNIFGQKPSVINPIRQKLPSLTQPTLVVWGRQDPIVPVAHAQAASRIPNARLKIFEHCGHIPQLEHEAAFDTAVQEFLG